MVLLPTDLAPMVSGDLELHLELKPSHKVFVKLFFKSQFLHKSVIITNVKNKLTDLCGN